MVRYEFNCLFVQFDLLANLLQESQSQSTSLIPPTVGGSVGPGVVTWESHSKQRQPALEGPPMVGSERFQVEPTKELSILSPAGLSNLPQNSVNVDYGDMLLARQVDESVPPVNAGLSNQDTNTSMCSDPVDMSYLTNTPLEFSGSCNSENVTDLLSSFDLDKLMFPTADSIVGGSDFDSWDLESLLTA